MKRWTRWLLAFGAVAATAVALRLTVLAPEPVEVEVARVTRGTVEEIVTNTRAGTVMARRRAKLSPRTGGQVVELPAQEGDRVRTGDLLLALDGSVPRARLELARRDVASARARAEEVCLAADLARRELERISALHRKGVASEQRLDAARTEADRAAAACRAAQAAVAEARAHVRLAAEELELTRLVAPFDGVVAEVRTEIGEWITPAPPGVPIPPVIDLIDPSSIYVSAPIDEIDAAKMRVGLPARVTVDPRPGEQLVGRLSRVAPYVEDRLEQNRTLEVEVELADPEVAATLLPGTSADVEIVVARRENVLRVPTSAVAEGGEVLVLTRGRLERRTVRAGLSNWQWTEVRSGLAEGALVVVSRTSTRVQAGVRARARVSAEKR